MFGRPDHTWSEDRRGDEVWFYEGLARRYHYEEGSEMSILFHFGRVDSVRAVKPKPWERVNK